MTTGASRLSNGLMTLMLWGIAHDAFGVVLDMREGVTDMSRRIQGLHQISLWICVVVGILVFGAMFLTMFLHP